MMCDGTTDSSQSSTRQSSDAAVDIIIATRNRAQALDQTIASLVPAIAAASVQCHLLVADNGSTDHTREVLARHRWIRHIVVPEVGKCRALNAAIRASRAHTLLFTDDDVRVPTDWVDRMTVPIREDSAELVVGAVVIPPCRLEALRSSPLAARLGWVADTSYINFAHPQAVVGANMAVARRVFESIDGFDPDLGPGAPETGFGEEPLLLYRMREAGFRVTGVPDAAVQHYFDISRADRTAVHSIAAKMARTNAYLSWHWMHTPWRVKPWTIARMRLRRLASLIRNRDGGEDAELDWIMQVEFQRALRRFQRRRRKYPPPSPGVVRAW